MTTAPSAPSGYTTLRRCASALGLPFSYLKREAAAARVPTVKAGRSVLADPATVKRVLDGNANLARRDAALNMGDEPPPSEGPMTATTESSDILERLRAARQQSAKLKRDGLRVLMECVAGGTAADGDLAQIDELARECGVSLTKVARVIDAMKRSYALRADAERADALWQRVIPVRDELEAYEAETRAKQATVYNHPNAINRSVGELKTDARAILLAREGGRASIVERYDALFREYDPCRLALDERRQMQGIADAFFGEVNATA